MASVALWPSTQQTFLSANAKRLLSLNVSGIPISGYYDGTGRTIASVFGVKKWGVLSGVATISLIGVAVDDKGGGVRDVELRLVASYTGLQDVKPSLVVDDPSVRLDKAHYVARVEANGWHEAGDACFLRTSIRPGHTTVLCQLKGLPADWFREGANAKDLSGGMAFELELNYARPYLAGYDGAGWMDRECEDAFARDNSILVRLGELTVRGTK